MADITKPSLLVEQKRIDAIIKNKNTAIYWENRKKAHEEVMKSLEHYAGKLKENVMVPIGKRGLMRGRIINTNQIFISLGAGWFTKVCTSEAKNVCIRRIQDCTNMLEKLEKEKRLLEGWTALGKTQVFGSEETKDLTEPYIEKEEEVWRRQHKEKVKEHKKKLADVQKAIESTGKGTNEELWKRLDFLELQEELQDELLRLGEDECSSEIEEEEEEFASSTSSLDSDDSPDESEKEEPFKKIIKGNELKSIINYKQKPANITNREKDRVKKVQFIETIDSSDEKDKLSDTNVVNFKQNLVNTALGEVVEHNVNKSNTSQNSSRPISKFKSSRISK